MEYPLWMGGALLPSLKLTASSPLKMDGWNNFSFPFGARPIFRGELLVSGSVVCFCWVHNTLVEELWEDTHRKVKKREQYALPKSTEATLKQSKVTSKNPPKAE